MARCRLCGKTNPEPTTEECPQCREYGYWYAQISSKPEPETTGTISLDDLVKLVDLGVSAVGLVLFRSERSKPWSLLRRKFQPGPTVFRIDVETVGMVLYLKEPKPTADLGDTAVERLWSLYRPFRMQTDVIIDGKRTQVITSEK